MTTPHDGDAIMEHTGLTRRQALKAGAATFIGYAVAVEKVEAQAIKTGTAGIEVGDYAGGSATTTCRSMRRVPLGPPTLRSSSRSGRSGAFTSG